jgi:hypothetical protein
VFGSSASATEEINVVYERALVSTTSGAFWVGLSNLATVTTDLHYQWVTDEPIPILDGLPPWASGQPYGTISRNCVEMARTAATLASVYCDDVDAFICECDGYAEDPSHF